MRHLVINWAPPEGNSRTVDVDGYRFYFEALPGYPAPFQASTDAPGLSHTGFQAYLPDAGTRWLGLVREEVRYRIHLVSVGPGGWESDPRVITVQVRAGGALTGLSSCTVVPEVGSRGLNFNEIPHDSGPEELPDDEVLEDEPEGDDSTSVPSPTPTEGPASPEDTLERNPGRDGPISTPSPDPRDEPDPPGEAESPEPEDPLTEEEPSESVAEQDTAEPSDDENTPERDGVP